MRDDAVLRRALPLGRGLVTADFVRLTNYYIIIIIIILLWIPHFDWKHKEFLFWTQFHKFWKQQWTVKQ